MAKGRKKRGKRVLGSHAKCWLWGRHVVLETLRAGRWPVLELHLAQDLRADRLDEAAQLALALDVPVKVQPGGRLEQLGHSPEHQGHLAKMGPFPYADAGALVTKVRDAAGQTNGSARRVSAPAATHGPPLPWRERVGVRGREGDDAPAGVQAALFAVLDRIQDPHNFGAMVRSAEVFGVGALFIAEREQAGVTTAVARSSAGAVNRVPIARVEDLVDLAGRLKGAGLALVGASEKAEVPLTDVDFRRPSAVVIGSEARGIRPALRDACDALVRIPQHGAIGSLNAAAAAAILFYEARRQRRPSP